MNEPFYKPRPVPPDENRQMKGLRWSLWVSVSGWIVYGAFAYAFADIAIIPPAVQSWMVLIGSALIVTGAESNTIATSVAALSKLGTDRISGWDYLAVIASVAGGICTPLITFSTRQTELVGTQWRAWATRIGPLILGIAGVFDFYGAVTELALAKRDYEQAMETWLEERRTWNDAHGATAQSEPKAETNAKPVQLTVARKPDFDRILDRLNGNRESLTEQQLADELARDQLLLPSQSTVNRWLRMARK